MALLTKTAPEGVGATPKTGGGHVKVALRDLDPSRRTAVTKRLQAVPLLHKKTYLKAVGKCGRNVAIRAFCLECLGWDRNGIHECTGLACPLWGYRPYQRKRVGSQKEGGAK